MSLLVLSDPVGDVLDVIGNERSVRRRRVVRDESRVKAG